MPINSFWTADDKIPIAQKKVSVPSDNGLEYSAGQKINITIPPTVQYIQPRESYLSWDVKVQLPENASGLLDEPTRIMLDEALGSQVLIRDIFIYSGGAGNILLEEYQNYNVLTGVKYDYETNATLRAKRALTEGALNHSIQCRGSCGTTESGKNDCVTNPYFKGVLESASSVSASFTNADFQNVKCLLPINTGIFSNDKVFPVLMTEGLKIEIILEQNTNVFRQLDTVLDKRMIKNGPIFHSTNGNDAAPLNASTGTPITTIYLTRDNNMINTPQVPFVVGERIGYTTFAGTRSGFTADPIISQIDYESGSGDYGLVKLTLDGTGMNIASGSMTNRGGVLYSRSNVGQPTYVVSNVEFVLQQLTMPEGYTRKMMSMMKSGGEMQYDFLSFTNYKYSQLASDTVANIRLPLNQSRAKAILCIPTDATNRTTDADINADNTYLISEETDDLHIYSDRSGLVGVADTIESYQFFYDGKLNPSRKVDCAKTSSRTSISQQQLIELEKALAQSKIIPYSFRAFQSNFVIGRALSLQDGILDTRGKDFNVQIEYPATAGHNHLWMNWVAHLRRITFNGDGISLSI